TGSPISETADLRSGPRAASKACVFCAIIRAGTESLKASPRARLDTITGRNTSAAITLAAIIVIVYGMQAAKVLLVPFLLAVFLALITVRPMLWLQRHRVPSILAALLVLVLIMLVLAVAGTIVGASIAEFTAALPAYQARLDLLVD